MVAKLFIQLSSWLSRASARAGGLPANGGASARAREISAVSRVLLMLVIIVCGSVFFVALEYALLPSHDIKPDGTPDDRSFPPAGAYDGNDLVQMAPAPAQLWGPSIGGLRSAQSRRLSVGQKAGAEESFVLVTQVYSRWSTVSDFVRLYSGCHGLARIIIVWNRLDRSPPVIVETRVPVQIFVQKSNSMNNRFRAFEWSEGRPIFLLDDDLLVEPRDIEFAFSVWRENSDRIVGFLPRHFTVDDSRRFVYKNVLDDAGVYSMILIGASIFHDDFARLYWSDHYSAHRAYVDKVFNCDDVLMNMIASFHSGKPPLQIRGLVRSIMNLTMRGMSEESEWYDKRNACLNDLSNPPYFNGAPLRATMYAVSRAEQQYEIVRVGIAPGRCGGVAGLLAGCGGQMAAFAARADYSVTAVLTSFARHHNIPRIVSTLDARYAFIQEVIVMNNDPNREIEPSSVGSLRTPVRIFNLEKNFFTLAKYLGCLRGSHPICYIQDDDFVPSSLNSLFAAFLLRPHVVHATTDEATYNLNMKWTFFDNTTGLHAGFAWLGTGSFVSRVRVEQFLRELDILELSENSRGLADLYFSIWANEIPATLISLLNQTALDTGRAFSAVGCDDCADRQRMNTVARMDAVKRLQERLSIPDDNVFNRNFLSGDFREYPIKAACANDECLFLTNMDPLPSLVFATKTDFNSLEDQNSKGWVVPRRSLAFREAVDGSDGTAWTLPRLPSYGDFFGLDLLFGQAVSGIRLVASHFNPEDFAVDASCSSSDGWVRKRFMVSSEPLLEGSERQVFIFRPVENVLGLRSFRLRWVQPLPAARAPSIYDVSAVVPLTKGGLKSARVLFVLTEIPNIGVDAAPSLSLVLLSRAEVLANTSGATVSVLFASVISADNAALRELRVRLERMGISFSVLPSAPPQTTSGPPTPLALLSASMLDWLEQQAKPFSIVHFSAYQSIMVLALQSRRVGLSFANTIFVAHGVPLTIMRRTRTGQFTTSAADVVATYLERRSLELAQVVVLPLHSVREQFADEGFDLDAPARELRGRPAEVFIVPPLVFREKRLDFGTTRQTHTELFAEAVVICDDSTTLIAMRILQNAISSLQQSVVVLRRDIVQVTITVVTAAAFERLEPVLIGLQTPEDSSGIVLSVLVQQLSYRQAIRHILESPRRFLCVLQGPLENGVLVADAFEKRISFVAPISFAELIPVGSRSSVLFDEESSSDLARVLLAFFARTSSDVSKTVMFDEEGQREQWITFNILLFARRGFAEFASVKSALTLFENSDTTPLVSVCIATRNRGRMLEAAVESVLASDFPASRMEIVIVDDHTDSESDLEVLRRVASMLLGRGIVTMNPGRGGISARNHAARVAKGALLFFFDDDDLLRPRTLTVLVNAMETTKADVVGGWIHTFMNPSPASDDEEVPITIHPMARRSRWVTIGGNVTACFFSNCFFVAGALHRREAFEKVGGWRAAPEGTAHQDYELFMREAVAGFRLELVPAIIYDYRRHSKKRGGSVDGARREIEGGVLKASVSTFRNRMHSLRPLLESYPEWRDILLFAFGNSDMRFSGNNDV